LTRFAPSPLPLSSEIRLLVGSAPWVEGQFHSKGIDLLLDVAQEVVQLHLTFLWRGVLYDEMVRRVARRGLDSRVEILNRRVDVNAVLARVHASVVLAENPTLVRAYPHSLIESLAAGKPVLASQGMPMAALLQEAGCGEVVTEFTAQGVARALEDLVQDYQAAARGAPEVARERFSQDQMVAAYRAIYRELAHTDAGA
jgi:glycosyltransferase involved in cell wall biosynthesis